MSWLRLMEEKLKEDEPLEILDEAEATQALHPPHKKHSVSGMIKDMWPAYLIEIIVIILGISITLALEEWRDNSKENHLEQIYLKNLLIDVEVDMNSLNEVSIRTQNLLKKGNKLLGYSKSPDDKNISPDQVNADVRAILGRPKFISSDASFSDLKSSGNLHLIKDIQLKKSLFAYYNETQQIKEVQDAEQQATIILSGTYFLKWFPLDDNRNPTVSMKPGEINDLLKNVEFNNNVLLRVSNRKELLDSYQWADSLAGQLKNELIKKTGYSE
ncbi:MAG TPA: hypothetical protein VKI61_15125 [Chitinophagaceae bacterium]|nr:hypothetical protein [Chitinophagaceae bacterium]